MGTDIYAKSGFTITLKELLNLIEPTHLSGIKEHAIKMFKFEIEGIDIDDLVEETIKKISESSDVIELREAFSDLFSDSDCDSDQRLKLIQWTCRVLLPMVPKSVRIFDNPRTVDWSGPYGEPILIFDSEKCFEVRMTIVGKNLAKALGREQIRPSSWTIYSV